MKVLNVKVCDKVVSSHEVIIELLPCARGIEIKNPTDVFFFCLLEQSITRKSLFAQKSSVGFCIFIARAHGICLCGLLVNIIEI